MNTLQTEKKLVGLPRGVPISTDEDETQDSIALVAHCSHRNQDAASNAIGPGLQSPWAYSLAGKRLPCTDVAAVKGQTGRKEKQQNGTHSSTKSSTGSCH